MNDKTIIAVHEYCTSNQKMLRKDQRCGCFYCLRIFHSSDITDWIADKDGLTAQCPFCGIDSVIGESSGYPITESFLIAMKKYWF